MKSDTQFRQTVTEVVEAGPGYLESEVSRRQSVAQPLPATEAGPERSKADHKSPRLHLLICKMGTTAPTAQSPDVARRKRGTDEELCKFCWP